LPVFSARAIAARNTARQVTDVPNASTVPCTHHTNGDMPASSAQNAPCFGPNVSRAYDHTASTSTPAKIGGSRYSAWSHTAGASTRLWPGGYTLVHIGDISSNGFISACGGGGRPSLPCANRRAWNK
jgi:hypothetical protein